MTERPTIIVLFGITGDLSQKKLLPALYDLYITGRLKDAKIVGFSRRDFSKNDIDDFVEKTLTLQNFDKSFLDLITYVSGQFDDRNAYEKLSEHLALLDKEVGGCSNKLFYLSVPPSLYEVICTNISESGLSIPCGGDLGFARVLIEKPFGKDLETAQKLDSLLGKLFEEEYILDIINIHRKEEDISSRWSSEHIERVEIDLLETATVGNRGDFYDGVGAFRDVGQNHMLQILALIAMEIPNSFEPELIQKSRADVLEHLIPAGEEEIRLMKRGQYDGYLLEPGVSPNSTTETFFSIVAKVDSGPLANTAFVLRSGKALSKNLTEVRIIFKDGTKIVISVPSSHSLPAYQKILLDCIGGDQTVFISTKEIMAEWTYITPIVEKTEKNKPFIYEIGGDPDEF